VKIKKGLKFGVELLNSLSANSGTFQNQFDFTFGAFTGLKLSSDQTSTILLRIEGNIINLKYFNVGNRYYKIVGKSDPNWNGLNYAVYDEKFSHKVLELAIFPEYSIILDEKTSLELFAGPSIGIGNKKVELKKLDKNSLTDYPYVDYNAGYVLPFSLNIGASLYYHIIVFELRFRNIIFLGAGGGKSNLNNVYAQIGLAL